MKLWILAIDTKHAADSFSAHTSHEEAHKGLHEWVSDFWEEDGPKDDMPDDPEEAIREYFAFADENYTISDVTLPTQQVLVTLRNGEQLFLSTADVSPQIQYRSKLSGSWGLPFDANERPHVPGTVFVGEW